MTEKVTAYLKTWADKFGCDLNPREKQIQKMADTKIDIGLYVCPCKVYVPGFTEDADIFCPCGEGTIKISAGEKCHCGIFVPKGEKS